MQTQISDLGTDAAIEAVDTMALRCAEVRCELADRSVALVGSGHDDSCFDWCCGVTACREVTPNRRSEAVGRLVSRYRGLVTDDEFRDFDEPADDGFDAVDADDGFDAVDAAEEPAATPPTEWQPPEPTGVLAVDEAVAVLTELESLPTAEHVAYYESAHRRLQDALADLDGA